MRLGLLVLLSLALCAAHTSDNETDAYFPAPYFDDGENLSSQNCGNGTNWRKWTFTLAQDDPSARWFFCGGAIIALSQRSLLGNCKVYDRYINGLYASSAKCYGRTEGECSRNKFKVLDVIEIPINPRVSAAFYIYVTEKIPSEFVAPICLFNRDNVKMDTQLQTESHHFQWSSGNGAPSKEIHSNCSRVLNRTELEHLKTEKIPIQNVLCVEYARYFFQYLTDFYKGRYFLRGIRYYGLERPVHLDILAYMDEIAKYAKDVYVLRPIPQTKQPKGFTAKDNLSFPNCGGKKAQTVDHPWHAFIENEVTGKTCGGTLISPTVVLTAAYCLYGSEAKDFRVAVGMNEARQSTAPGVQTRKPSSLIVHPKYNDTETNSDVGLIILNEKINLTDNVRPICLWNEDSNLTRVAGIEATAVGFGLVDDHTRTDELQEARLPIRDHKECYLSKRNFFGKYLRPGDNFCAGYTNGTTTCNGDSGGSLSVEKDGRWFIRGIVSFGISKIVEFEGKNTTLCHSNEYTLFADVASYMDWIVENTPEISFRN
ncbi:CLIP domain-containing serine protease B10-like isoform X2 [Cloeon dipterum]|uniref:CLIP domain-containing serine protease B10-like isoform X2 n=1 Tax=Cloeon dipterum TaxID=197152 RepID=UPI00322051AC